MHAMIGNTSQRLLVVAPERFGGLWFVVRTEAQRERTVAAGLIGKRFGCYLPMCERRRAVRRGTLHRIITRPMLTGYIFATFDFCDHARVGSIAGVIDVLGYDFDLGDGLFERRPVPIPTAIMYRIRDKELELATGARKVRSSNDRELKLGQYVRVMDGPVAGFFGVVVEVYPGRERCRVEVDMFGRKTPAELLAGQVEVL